MYCINCGKKIPETSKFCPYCGSKTTIINNNSIIAQNNANHSEKSIENGMNSAYFSSYTEKSKQSEVYSNSESKGRVIIKREGPIRLIPTHEILTSESKSRKLLIYIAMPLSTIAGFFALFQEDMRVAGLLIMLLCGGGFAYFIYYEKKIMGEEYIPTKSFSKWRWDRNKIKKYIHWGYALVIVFAILGLMIGISIINILYYTIACLISIYWTSKSIKVHEDIDYAANQALEGLVGMEIDERIVASYQNFDTTNQTQNNNDNLIVLTNRKIFFAQYKSGKWYKMDRYISEIAQIGLASVGQQDEYVAKMVFTDNTVLALHLSMCEHLSSYPTLFIKKLLETLDDSILGIETKTRRRRRRTEITTSDSPIAPSSTNESKERKIELSSTSMSAISSADEFAPGRQIEL